MQWVHTEAPSLAFSWMRGTLHLLAKMSMTEQGIA